MTASDRATRNTKGIFSCWPLFSHKDYFCDMLVGIAIHSLFGAEMDRKFLVGWTFFSFPMWQKSLLSGDINVIMLLHMSAKIIHFKVDVAIILAVSVHQQYSGKEKQRRSFFSVYLGTLLLSRSKRGGGGRKGALPSEKPSFFWHFHL